VVERGGSRLRFRPGDSVADLRGARWDIEGELAALAAVVEGGRLRSDRYPDPLARVFSALTAPHAGDLIVSLELGYEALDWGGASHAGGGSHGSLHRDDSLGPLLFCGCGPEDPGEREQWTLRDVAPACSPTSDCETSPSARRRPPSLPARRRSRRHRRPLRRGSHGACRPRSEGRHRAPRAPRHDLQRLDGRRQLGGQLLRRRRAGRAGDRRTEDRRRQGVLDRLSGRLEDGARLLGRLRPQG